MTYTFDLRPLAGAGPLDFGMNREAANKALGKMGLRRGTSHGASDYYVRNALQLEFSPAGELWFIGLSRVDGLAVTFHRKRVDTVRAEDVAAAFAEREADPPTYNSGEMLFPKQILTLWDAAPQYHPKEEFAVWAQIGIGSAKYLAAIRR